ncbi:MAG: UPF0182 family protein [Vicinamibacteria bacterium]|nr:UPF0182 family protein [Vicinamibacteria bacterium]
MTRRLRPLLFAALFALVFVLPGAVSFYTDWLWFGETGYQAVYGRTLFTQSVLVCVTTLAALAVLVATMRVALAHLPQRELVMMSPEGPMSFNLDRRRLQAPATAIAAVIALFFGTRAAADWQLWLMALHAQPFGTTDPILGKDVGFYVFQLPVLEAVQGTLLGLVVIAMVASVAVYALAGTVSFDAARGLRVGPPARRHLSVLAAALLLVLAFGAWLDVPRLLVSPSGLIHGATNADVTVMIPALRALLLAAVIGAGLALAQTRIVSWWPLLTAAALYVGVGLAGTGAAAVMQRFVIGPNEQVRELPYIEHNIAATRAAFGLGTVEERELSGDALLTRADIDANAATLGNVRLWDHQPLLQTFAQIQEIRTYYDFVSVHNDRYKINGEYRQIMLSARELNSESLPNRNWINERLTFTHGYGLTLGPVNQVTPEGLPVLFIKDLPPQSSVDLTVTEPSIYFGQESNDHVFVKTKAREFHYPKGDDNVYTTYEGRGGVPISSFLRRLLFSIRFRSFKVLLSDDITNDSRVMFHRRLNERVSRVAPFLQFDADPYLVISQGRLFWMQDAYTVSRHYPYSTPAASGVNYIRNSVKVTVDAFHGTIAFYLIDESDPVARTLRDAFPTLFRPMAEMPEDMRTRMRYPEGIFALQAAMYATYHMTNPAVFYNKEDLWEVPTIDEPPQPRVMQPYYTMMRLPGEQAPEFIQMLPFTPARKDNLASWMVARSDGANYGHLRVFQFPKQKVVFGPRQIVARINQDQAISPQITLWNQQGSEVLQGTLLVIPIEESLVYVRPLYLRSAGGRIPELKRVIVAHHNQIVMEDTLDKALDRLFPRGGAAIAAGADQMAPSAAPGAVGPTPPSTGNTDPLSAQALDHYRRALKAQRDGNWALYGEQLEKLGTVLEQLEKRR